MNMYILFLYYVHILANNPVFLLFPQLFHVACVGAIDFKVCKMGQKVKKEKKLYRDLDLGLNTITDDI